MKGSAINRRRALRNLAFAAGGLLSGSRLRGAKPTWRPGDPAEWRKEGVVLKNDGSPESGWLQNFTSAAEPLEGNRWRLWCSVSGRQTFARNIGYAEGVPGEELEKHFAVLSEGDPEDAPLAIGNLPAGWRPVQGVHLELRDGRDRLYFWAHGNGVVRYLAADSEDGRRYRVIDPLRACLYHPADRAVDGKAAAEAGLLRRAERRAAPQNGEPLAPAGLISNDATNVYQLDDGSFEMYSVALREVAKGERGYVAHDNAAGWVRVIDRYESGDGLSWGGRKRVIVPDAKDPADQQFYYLSVTHTEFGRVGILGHYRVEEQTIDMEWCFSKDGITWERPARGGWLPRGEAGELDSELVHAPHSMVRRDGKWWLFYTGGNFSHNFQRYAEPMDRGVMLATRRELFA